MGKDWLYWGGGSNSCAGARRSTKKGSLEGNHHTPSGCMRSVFQLFDFHHFQFALHHQVPTFKSNSFVPDEPTTLKGVEAPRNSLEMDGAFTSFSSTMKGEETLSIPMGIQIKTRTDDLSSEFSSSPGSKTPNLVARLMGLDLLPPDICSTSLHSSVSNPPLKSLPHCQQTTPIHRSSSVRSRNLFDDIMGSRSLPETPRISSGRRSDVEYHHRLSLQINKENINATDDLSGNLAVKIARRRDQVLKPRQELVDDSRSPAGKYAKQIVKQVKEKLSRKVGLDITNTITNRDQIREREDDDDDSVVLLKPKKTSKGCERADDQLSLRKLSNLSSSPRLRKQNQAIPSGNAQPETGRVSLKQKSQEVALQNRVEKNCKKIVASEAYKNSPVSLKKHSNVYRNKQEEAFVRSSSVTNRANLLDKKTKKTPLSSELLNTNVLPSLFPVKKDPSSSSSAVEFSQKQSQDSDALSSKISPAQLSSSLSPLVLTSYRQEAKHTPTVQDLISRYNNSNYAPTNGGSGTEFQYITRILNRTGILNKNIPLSSSFTQSQWYSPSHPLNPSIFNHLEISFLSNLCNTTASTAKEDPLLSHRCNRKLIFQLVDEILVEILKPYTNLKPWGVRLNSPIHGSALIEKICSKIRSFPSADCRVLEDIDELIDRDLCVSEVRLGSMALEEEGDAIVAEVERHLVESLVHEMALGVVFGSRVSCDVGSRGHT